ncbi:hypothetical protein DV735_g229, partial [Chaetothyriales sp. CBS 134920]
MPTLRNLSCQILWADTDTPLQEYGTQYGDGVVETYVAVPDKPRRFYIRLTSKGFVHQGLAAIVFVDGTYQCNRNRVNLVPPKKGLPRERSEINFVMRQKEKTMGEGLYMGRQWRFDDHNIVPDPPKMSEGDHFKFLGTIEVIVLRCCARRVDECDASDISSAAESQILETALSGRPSSPVDYPTRSISVNPRGIDKAVETEDEPLATSVGSTKDQNNSSAYVKEDLRDGYESQNVNENEPSGWSNDMATGTAEDQWNEKDFQYPPAAEIFTWNQDSHQVSEATNVAVTASQNEPNRATDTRGYTFKPTGAPYLGGVDGTPHSGTNPTDNNGDNFATGPHLPAVPRPLYGPHGTYFAMRSPAALDAPCDAEEEPRYDVPKSYVDSYGTTKQVQPGKGYLYTKKRYSPKYVDDLKDPYARFVFIYRTKEQLKNDLDLTIDTLDTDHEEVEKLQNASKDELIQMLLRAQTALGGKIPSPTALGVTGSGQRAGGSSEPVTFEPPDAAHLDYHIPGRWPADGPVSDSVGRGGLNGAVQPNNGGDQRQQSWEQNNIQNSEIPAPQPGNGSRNNQDLSWGSSYQAPAVQAVNDTTNNQGVSWSNNYQAPTVQAVNEPSNNQDVSWGSNYQAPAVQDANDTTNSQDASWSNSYQAPAVQEVNNTTNNQGLTWSTDYQDPNQNEDHQSRKAAENDRNGDPGQQMSWQSNQTVSNQSFNRQDTMSTTENPRQAHDSSPEREFSAPLIAEETEEPAQQAKGAQGGCGNYQHTPDLSHQPILDMDPTPGSMGRHLQAFATSSILPLSKGQRDGNSTKLSNRGP